jgi:hypothetical protein
MGGIIKLAYLPAFSAFVSNFWHFQPFSAVSAIFNHYQANLPSNLSEEPSASYSRFPEIIGTHRTFNDRQLLKMAENG